MSEICLKYECVLRVVTARSLNCNLISFIEQRNLESIKSVQWARDHKDDALKDFEKRLGKPVTRTGVWISSSGVLCASPDGFVNDCIVEIKCYYKSRESSLRHDLSTDLSYVIRYNTASKAWVVNESHEYFHQIQGRLYLSNKKGCYLVVWTPKEIAIVPVKKSADWAKNVKEMENFYFDKFVPYLLQN